MTDQEYTPIQTIEPTIADVPVLEAGPESVLNEAVKVIDEALAKMMQRELVASGEVADLLLDVRTLLTRR